MEKYNAEGLAQTNLKRERQMEHIQEMEDMILGIEGSEKNTEMFRLYGIYLNENEEKRVRYTKLMRDLSEVAFKILIYLATTAEENEDWLYLSFSRSDFCKWIGITPDQYQAAIDELIEYKALEEPCDSFYIFLLF